MRKRLACGFLWTLVATALLMLSPVALFAQAIPAPPASATFDWTAVAINFVTGLQVLIVPLLVTGVRNLLPSIPRVALPFVALALGVFTDGFATWVAGGGFSPLRGALVGLAAVVLREIVSTLAEHGARP
jgi:hypothetical protein